MPLMPDINLTIDTTEQDIETSRTYKLDLSINRIIGIVDEKESLHQAIQKIINTERYKYLIYTHSYGAETHGMLASDYTPEFIETEFSRLIMEALLEDERILTVTNFTFKFESDSVFVAFIVDSVFGEIHEEVNI